MISKRLITLISSANLIHNINEIKKITNNSKIIAVIKGNAYGHGLLEVAKIIENQVTMFALESIDDAVFLKENLISTKVLLISGVFDQEELIVASEIFAEVVFYNYQQLKWISEIKLKNKIDVWIKINTGMNRLGFNIDEYENVSKILRESENVNNIKIMSHFASANFNHIKEKSIVTAKNVNKINLNNLEKNDLINKISDYNNKKILNELNLEKVNNTTDIDFINRNKRYFQNQVQCRNMDYIIKSTSNIEYSFCNSAAIFNFPDYHYDYVRPGISLYGISNVDNKKSYHLNLKPVMTFKSKIISIHELKPGDYIGYDSEYKAEKNMRIGVIACGYDDGYPNIGKKNCYVLINGYQCKLISCSPMMHMMSVDLSDVNNVEVGSEVILWGEELLLEDLCESLEISPYSLLIGMNKRSRLLVVN